MVLSDLTAFDVAAGDYGPGSYDFAHKELGRVENEHPCTCQIKGKRNQEARMGSPMSGYPSLLSPADLDPDCELHFPWRVEDDDSRVAAMRVWAAGYQVGYGTGGQGVRDELVEADPEVQGLMLREWGAGAADLERVLAAFVALQERVELSLGDDDPEVAGSLEAAALLAQWAAAARSAERGSDGPVEVSELTARREVLPEGVEAEIFELADRVANPGGYADDAAEADRRALLRDGLVVEVRRVLSAPAAAAAAAPAAEPVSEAAAVRAAIDALGVSGSEVAAALAGDVLRWPAERCEDCGKPCLYVEALGDWRHVDPAATCFLIQSAWGGVEVAAAAAGEGDGESIHGVPADTADALLSIAGLERDGEGRYGGRFWDRGEAVRDALIVVAGVGAPRAGLDTYTALRDFLDRYTNERGEIQGDPATIAGEAVAAGLVARDGNHDVQIGGAS